MAGYSKIILRKAIIRRWTSLKCIFWTLYLLSIVQLNVLALFIFFGQEFGGFIFLYNNTTTSKYYNDPSRTSSNMYKQLINYYLFDKLIRARNIVRLYIVLSGRMLLMKEFIIRPGPNFLERSFSEKERNFL